jgi:hypothetical protein
MLQAIRDLMEYGHLSRSPVSGKWGAGKGRRTFSHQTITELLRQELVHFVATRAPRSSDYGWHRVPCRIELTEKGVRHAQKQSAEEGTA